MKKHLIQTLLLSSLLVVSISLIARPVNNDSTETYNYWSKRGVIEMVYAYIQDYLTLTDSNKVLKEVKGANNYRKYYIDQIDSINIGNFDFQSISKFLIDNNWKGIEDALLKGLIIKIDKKSPLDDNFFVINTNNNSNLNWNKTKDIILNNYKKELGNYKKSASSVNVSAVITQSGIKDSLDKTNSFGVVILKFFYFLLGLIIGAFSLYQISKSKITSILSEELNHYESKLEQSWRNKYFFKYIAIISVLKERKDNKNTLIEEQEKELIKLRFNLDKEKMIHGNSEIITDNLIDKEDKHEHSEEIYAGRVIELEVETVNTNTKSNIYFTIPENDGSFKISNARNSKEVDCFYKIELDKNGQNGKVHFISGEYDSRALDNIDYYLNPVCDIQNISERIHARKIIQDKPGSVYISGDYWKIDTNNKVKIRFN